jgi:exonuclease III
VVSWNVNGGREGAARILEELALASPDVCLLQELPERENGFFEPRLTGYFEGFHRIETGELAILSRHPIRALPTRSVGPWSEPQTVALDLPSSGPVLLCNVHLVHPSLFLNLLSPTRRRLFLGLHHHRLQKYPRLAALLDELSMEADTRGVIIAGDFNIAGGAASLPPLKAIGTDVWETVGSGWGTTHMRSFPLARIDQCWVGGALKPLRAWVC